MLLRLAKTLRLHPHDDVVVATAPLTGGEVVDTDDGPVRIERDVAAGHKVATRSRAVGEPVRRYGQVIGRAIAPIRAGDHVHVHNLAWPGPSGHDPRAVLAPAHAPAKERAAPLEPRSFEGYARADGRVGTRNYVAVLSTVNCSASVTQMVRDRFRDAPRDHANVDGVIALTHSAGCGHVAGGEDHLVLERTLAGYAHHPNVAAYVVIGLGCEVAQAAPLVERHRLPLLPGHPFLPVITIQDEGGIRKTVEAASRAVAALLPVASDVRRTRRTAADLVLATNCGGSDGHSGITANPALGWAFDAIVRMGGTGILGETPEVFGAEQLLVERAADEDVARKFLDCVERWREHLRRHGVSPNSNPSPGNVAGGITTIAEKSLGSIAKSGTTPLVDVVAYAERVARNGFVYMDTPGYDPMSVTGMVAGGANVLCFTTGRGSVFGSKPVPSIKLASNSDLYRRMEDDMDVDCGVVLEGSSIEEVGRRILDEIFEVASGKPTKSELAGVGEAEFVPWMKGPVL